MPPKQTMLFKGPQDTLSIFSLFFFFFYFLFIYKMSLSPSSFQNAKARVDISYKVIGEKKVIRYKNELLSPGQPFANHTIQVTSEVVRHTDGKGGYVLSIGVRAFKPIEMIHFEATYLADLKDQRMMANGFQSWSQAREFTKNDKIPAIRSSIAWYTQLNLQGYNAYFFLSFCEY